MEAELLGAGEPVQLMTSQNNIIYSTLIIAAKMQWSLAIC